MTMTIEDRISDPIEAPATPDPSEPAPPGEAAQALPQAPPTPTLADLMSAAENEVEDTAAKAQEELAVIVGRADQPFHGDGQRFLQLVGQLQIPRTVARAAVEAVAGWNRQRDRTQADVAKLESRQAELTREITDLEAKQGALAIDPRHVVLLGIASAFVAAMHWRRTPGVAAGLLASQGWKGDQHGWNRGNNRCLPLELAVRKTLFGLLQTDIAKEQLRQLCAAQVRRGGLDPTSSASRLTKEDLSWLTQR
jgi:hypothetical protein